MAMINIALSESDYNQLQGDYKNAFAAAGAGTTIPTFEQWLAQRAKGAAAASPEPMAGEGMSTLRAVNAIEKLITNLRLHGFALAHVGRNDVAPADAARELAESIVNDLGLARQQSKRIQELIEYYSKGAKEVADLAQVGVTNRTYGALHEAYRELVDRTDKALERLGEERAIGRVEGAIAILVNLHVMDRQAAQERTESFKSQARNPKKHSG